MKEFYSPNYESTFVLLPTKCQCGCEKRVWFEKMIRKIVGIGYRPGIIHYNYIIPEHKKAYELRS